MYVYRVEGQDYIDFTISTLRHLQLQKEAWYERQTGQDRQSGHSRIGVSEQRPKGIFPPVDIVRVLPRGVHSVLPLTFALEVFYIYITAVVYMDLNWDRIRR